MNTMKALVKAKPEKGLWLQDVPIPEVGINDVLIKIQKTSICGTDVHIYNWDQWARKTIPVPMHVGHEFVGRVAAVGSNVHDFKTGDLVSGEGHLVCGRCRNCLAGRRHLCPNTSGVGVNRAGAFAEYLCIPVTNVWYCDPNIPTDVLSCFDPLGNATHTALSFDVLGEDVLITGAGPIECMATAIVRHAVKWTSKYFVPGLNIDTAAWCAERAISNISFCLGVNLGSTGIVLDKSPA